MILESFEKEKNRIVRRGILVKFASPVLPPKKMFSQKISLEAV
jgi:hypothetical protein